MSPLCLLLLLALSLLASPSVGQAVPSPPITLTFEYSHPAAAASAAPLTQPTSPLPIVAASPTMQTGPSLPPSPTATSVPHPSHLLQAEANTTTLPESHPTRFNLTADVIPLASPSSPSPGHSSSLPASNRSSSLSNHSAASNGSHASAAVHHAMDVRGSNATVVRFNRTTVTTERRETDGEQVLPQQESSNDTHASHSNRSRNDASESRALSQPLVLLPAVALLLLLG